MSSTSAPWWYVLRMSKLIHRRAGRAGQLGQTQGGIRERIESRSTDEAIGRIGLIDLLRSAEITKASNASEVGQNTLSSTNWLKKATEVESGICALLYEHQLSNDQSISFKGVQAMGIIRVIRPPCQNACAIPIPIAIASLAANRPEPGFPRPLLGHTRLAKMPAS